MDGCVSKKLEVSPLSENEYYVLIFATTKEDAQLFKQILNSDPQALNNLVISGVLDDSLCETSCMGALEIVQNLLQSGVTTSQLLT